MWDFCDFLQENRRKFTSGQFHLPFAYDIENVLQRKNHDSIAKLRSTLASTVGDQSLL